MIKRFLTVLSFASLLFASCGREKKHDSTAGAGKARGDVSQLSEEGRAIFSNRRLGEVDIACIDCHADYAEEAETGDRIRPGHSIVGAARRIATFSVGLYASPDYLKLYLPSWVDDLDPPPLWILDEPFTGLDDGSAAALVARLKELRDEGRIVVLATHDLDVAEGLLDRAAVLREGKLLTIDESHGPLRERYRAHVARQ